MIVSRRIAITGALSMVASARLAVAAPARDWSKIAVRTPDGAFVQGNPNAKVKLVEILSLTCPHCAHFEGEAVPPLTSKYIRPGLVSYEVRHMVRDSFDMVASLLARCAGPAAFFAVTPALFAQQARWIEQAGRYGESNPPLEGLSPAQQLRALAHGAGLDAFFRAHGLAPTRANACLADGAAQAALVGMTERVARLPGFAGTPSLVINGTMIGTVGWAELDRQLAAALR